jgi:hypothetical protein
MADWKRFRQWDIEELKSTHKDMFVRMNLSEEDVDGFGRGEVVNSAVTDLEDRCSLYAIVGASALRMGINGSFAHTHRPQPQVEAEEDRVKLQKREVQRSESPVKSPRRFTARKNTMHRVSSCSCSCSCSCHVVDYEG